MTSKLEKKNKFIGLCNLIKIQHSAGFIVKTIELKKKETQRVFCNYHNNDCVQYTIHAFVHQLKFEEKKTLKNIQNI